MATTQQAIMQLMQERGIDPSTVNMSQFRDFAGPQLQAYREAQPVERSGIPTNDLRDALAAYMLQGEVSPEVPATTPQPMPVETQALPPQMNPNQAAVSTQGAVRTSPQGAQGVPAGGVLDGPVTPMSQNAAGPVERTTEERIDSLDEAIMRELSGQAQPGGGGVDTGDGGSGVPLIPIVPYAPGASRSPTGSQEVIPANPEVTRATMTGIHPQGGVANNVIDVDPRAALPSPDLALPPPAAPVDGSQSAAPASPRPSGPPAPQGPVEANVQQSMEAPVSDAPAAATPAQQTDRAATVDDLMNMSGPQTPTNNVGPAQPSNEARVFGSGNNVQVVEPTGQVYSGEVKVQTNAQGNTRYVTDDGRVFDNSGRLIGRVGDSLQSLMRNIRGAL